MAQSGFTPISLYLSTTAAAVPTSGNLVAGELALNTTDEKLYFKNTAGTVKQLSGGVAYTVTKTANYTAIANDGVLTNTTAGAFTVNLPASPSNGAQVIVADAGGTWGTNNLTVGRNGSNIADVAQDLICDISGVLVQFVYNSSGTATWEVYAQVGGNGGTVVTLDGTQTLTNKTLTAPTIASANLTTALTLAGAAGTAGQVITSAGSGLPSWATPSAGAMILISTQTASAASSVVFSSGITYNRYVLYGRNIFSASGNPRLYLNVNAITSNYDTGFFGVTSSGTFIETTGGSTGVFILPQTSQTNTSMNNFVLEMSGMTGTDEKSFVGSSFLFSGSSSTKAAGTIGGNLITTTAASSFTLAFDSGTLNGVFSLYGVTV